MAHDTAGAMTATDHGARLSISEVSDLLGISTHTARYYERVGLIEVSRSQSGHRIYDQKMVSRLDFLVRMRASGMGISELCRYVELVRAGESTTQQRLQIMLEQRERIISQIHDLELALATTEFKITTYGGAPNDPAPRGKAASAPAPRDATTTTHRPQGDPS